MSFYNNLLKADTDYYNAYAGIGVCFEKLGKINSAARYYRKFLSLNPFSKDSEFIFNRLQKIQKNKDILKIKQDNIKNIPEKFYWEEIVKNLDIIWIVLLCIMI